MAQGSVQITFKPRDAARIPDSLSEGTSLLIDLRQRGVVDGVGRRLRIRRQGGYSGVDVWLALLVFFTTGATRGIRAFWDVLRPVVRRVAAVAGRRLLPSPASLSRALDSVEVELLREESSWLLTGASGVDEVLRHPVVRARDALGQDWHTFDLDPTVTTLRQRALPADDDLPEPRRRAEHTGAPGHMGRKRGDIVHRRTTVQHTGSGVWIHAHLSPGNGEGVLDFERGLCAIVQTCHHVGHPLSRALVRMDGEYGNVPWFTACRERGLPFVTRLNRPKLYEDPDVLERLRTATWYRVPDSKSGPRRSATDLGVLTIHPGQQTRRPDGTRYEPIIIRVVACVFEKTSKAKRGRTVDGMQVELFAVDAPADAWPAPEAVAFYFGRAAEENRFSQEDREIGLDRILSYHLPGQELAALVGLSLWNMRLARGFELAPPPAQRPAQPLRCAPIDDSIPVHWPRDPVVCALLAKLDWDALLSKRTDWLMNCVTGELLCPQQRALTMTTVRPAEHADGRTGIIFRRPTGGCEACESRPGCHRSARPQTPKHAEFSVPTDVATRLRERLCLVRGARGRSTAIKPIDSSPGPHSVADSLFLPATARQTFQACFLGSTLRIEVELPETHEPPLLLAVDVADRQRRRKTWAHYAQLGIMRR